jgi:hypothetical protein
MDLHAIRKRYPDMPVMTNLSRLDLPGAPVETISVDEGLDEMWDRMAGFREGKLFLDEVGVFLPSRMWAHIPLQLQAKWAQLRKDGIDLFTTAITISSMVKDLRDITWETNVCSSWQRFGFFIVRTYSGIRVGDKRFYQGSHFRPFRPGLAGKLYDTMGKVKAPQWAGKSVRVITNARPSDSVSSGGVVAEGGPSREPLLLVPGGPESQESSLSAG